MQAILLTTVCRGLMVSVVGLLFLQGCSNRSPVRASLSITLDGPTAPIERPREGLKARDNQTDNDSGSSSPAAPNSPSGGGLSGGGSTIGGSSAPSLDTTVITRGLYSLIRVAGGTTGGLVLGGDSLTAEFSQISGITRAPDGTLFVCDPLTHHIRALPQVGPTYIVAGSGDGRSGDFGDHLPAVASRLDRPIGLIRDERSGALIFCDSNNHRIRYFLPGGRIYSLVGGGIDTSETVPNALNAQLDQPFGLSLDANGNLYFTERGSGRVRRRDAEGRVTTLAVLAPGEVGPVAVNAGGDRLWVGEGGRIHLLYPLASPALQTAAVEEFPDSVITGLAYNQHRTLYAARTRQTPFGLQDTVISSLATASSGRLASGRIAETVAGNGNVSLSDADYSAPVESMGDARASLLAGSSYCSLHIDLEALNDPTVASGQLYSGNSYSDTAVGVNWGQLVRLTPEF